MECPAIGVRVLVPLGKTKTITGIVYRRNTQPLDPKIKIKNIIEILDQQPIITQQQLQLWEWIADYYMCHLGEVMAAALPGGIIDDNYTALTTTYLTLNQPDQLNIYLNQLQRAHKQQQALLTYLHLCHFDRTGTVAPVDKRILIETSGQSTAIIRQLVDKHILREEKQTISRLRIFSGETTTPKPLNPYQQDALDSIQQQWHDKEVVLLHGVTSSGKTEIYIHLIEQQLKAGKTVLYLVPEIALTTQLTERLHCVFGQQLVVFHSRFTDSERVEIYHDMLNADGGRVVVGARSALFLPLNNLGLVIVDEEHESSYKQQSPAPRYHARSASIILAKNSHAKVLLGTATPAIETYHNALTGKYGLVSLTHRYANLQLPRIRLIDLERQYHRKEMYGHFADPLVDKINNELNQQKQIIIFQNRRGYAPYIECTQCHQPPRCVNCDISLTEHKRAGTLVCHYCGYTIPLPRICPQCGGQFRTHGFGTERIEEETQHLFPKARIARMDLDSTRNKNAYQKIINSFADHNTDILIGTQMVTKGLHFDNVSTVAVLNADNLMNQPDFRSYERAYQMLEQVSGRAGRKGQQGEVLIQTFDTKHPILSFVTQHDYQALYNHQIAERELFRYPPFFRLITLVLRHHQKERLTVAANLLHQYFKVAFGWRCSDIIEPSISKIQSRYILNINLRFEIRSNIGRAKQMIAEAIKTVGAVPNCKGTQFIVDVDPL